jgi:hypothetical protein
VAELAFRDGIMDQIRLREQRFDERAYLFLLAAPRALSGTTGRTSPHYRT